MCQPLPLHISPMLPNFIRAVRVAHLPNLRQARVTKADGAEEVVEEVGDWPPAKVRMV